MTRARHCRARRNRGRAETCACRPGCSSARARPARVQPVGAGRLARSASTVRRTSSGASAAVPALASTVLRARVLPGEAPDIDASAREANGERPAAWAASAPLAASNTSIRPLTDTAARSESGASKVAVPVSVPSRERPSGRSGAASPSGVAVRESVPRRAGFLSGDEARIGGRARSGSSAVSCVAPRVA